MPNKTLNRFDMLDGLRGIAAIAVMIHHYTSHNGLEWLSGAWVAVDLFFVLSGFVIAHSYGAKILDGMGAGHFLATRLIRLGPLYLVGLLIGVMAAALRLSDGDLNGITSLQLTVATLLGAVCLPYLNSFGWPFGDTTLPGTVFPLNDPSWSLFFEIAINLFFFWYVTRYRQVASLALVIGAVTLFALCIVGFRAINPGWGTENFVFGLPRVLAGFFVGAWIHQAGCHLKRPAWLLVALVVGIALGGFFVENENFQLINSFTFVPLAVMLASAVPASAAMGRVCKSFGDLSYPLYVLHFPLYRLIWDTTDVRLLTPVLQTVVICIASLGVALVFRRIDEKVRNRLMARLTMKSRYRSISPRRRWQ